MKEIDFLDAVGRVDMQYIEECITYKPPKKINVWIKRMSAVAACFMAVIAAVLIFNHSKQPIIIDENGFYIEDGVLLRYTGTETDVTIPETVKTIADFTFLGNANANKIQVVRLGASVQKVETNAFAGLENLLDIIIAVNNLSFVEEDGLLMTSDGSILLRYEREDETLFKIPDSVHIVAAHAVQGTKLEEIDFGKNLEYIGYNAFASNYELKAIYLPDSVQYISEGAFSGCSSAVDGYVPKNADVGVGAFWCVPFYNSMLAGQMCPGEEIQRGLVTPSEAIVKSDLYSLTEQIKYVLAAMRGDSDYTPSEAAMFAHAAASDVPKVPENMAVPEDFTMHDLSFANNDWGGTGIYDLQIFLPAGDYTIVMEAYGYGLFEELYWSESRFRLAKVYYIQNPHTIDPENTVNDFGWTVVFGRENGKYSGITYTHTDGRIIRSFLPAPSETPYELTFSPSGTRVAVEYSHSGKNYFYVQSLNGDKLMHDLYDYNEYLSQYWSAYTPGSLTWIDDDNIEGVNELGQFRFNIYEFEINQQQSDAEDYASFERILSMPVSELRTMYGNLKLAYSEHGPGQPVYSVEYFPGAMLVFYQWNMEDPLTDEMIPAELILTDEYSIPFYGFNVGMKVEQSDMSYTWDGARYSVINGTVQLWKAVDDFVLTLVVSGENLNLPAEDTASKYDWKVWEAEYTKNPTGEIVQIRLKLNS